MADRAKNRKILKRQIFLYPWADFIQTSQECCLPAPLLKLLKRFRSDEQNGRQS